MDKMQLGIKGEITILRGGKPVFKENNTITANALEIILEALSSKTSNRSIDTISLSGLFGTVDKFITETTIDLFNKSITFKARVLESDFNGTVTSMALNMSGIDKDLATKADISVTKDGDTEIEVQWKITLIIL